MDWGQYIKRTAVRRVVWIIVGLAVYAALSLMGVARAHEVEGCSVGSNPRTASCDTRQQAYQWASTLPPSSPNCAIDQRAQWNGATGYSAQYLHSTQDGRPSQCGNQWITSGGAAWTSECPVGHPGQWNDDLKRCALPCEGLGPRQYNRNTSIWGAPPAEACVSGCAYTVDASSTLCTLVEEGPTSGYWCNSIYQPTGGTCEAGEDIPPPDPDAPDATCSADEVRLPNGQCSPRGQCPIGQHEVDGACHPVGNCPAYHVKAPDGSCTPVPCPSGQARGQDGTCKADGNSDGTPDEEGPEGDSDNKDGMGFSGGQSCSVPPTCSGDPIMCGQARIQWQIECNTRRAERVEGGNACDIFNMPICIGEGCDPVQHKQLIVQWEAMCALRDLVSQDGDGEGDGGGDLGGIKDGIDRIGDFLDGGGNCMSTEEGCDPVEVPWDDEAPEKVSWSSGLSSTGTCPAPVSTTITLAGYSAPIEFSYQPICDFAALMRWVLITAATIVSGLIVAGLRSTGGGA